MKQTVISSQNKPLEAYLEAMELMMHWGCFIQSFTFFQGKGTIIVNDTGVMAMSQEREGEIYRIIDDVSNQERENRNGLL